MSAKQDVTRWWLSWCQAGEDSRPVKWPPPDGVLAFWESGLGDGYVTVVALVDASSEESAKATITGAWKPGVGEWRFCRVYGEGRNDGPPGDRFPPPAWSVKLKRWPWPVTA